MPAATWDGVQVEWALDPATWGPPDIPEPGEPVGVWTVLVTDLTGTPISGTALPSAVPGEFSFRRGFLPGEFSFTFSVWDPVAQADLPIDQTLERRVELYEDGVLRWRGVPGPWKVDFDRQQATINCKTHEWYFDRRFFGWVERTNILENGSFEDWTAGTSSPPDAWGLEGSATVARTAAIAEGTYAARLTATDSSSYLWQQEAADVDIDYWPGLLAVGTAWGKVVSGSVAKGDVLAELIVDGTPGTFTEPFIAPAAMSAGTMFRVSIELLVTSGIDWTGEMRVRSINGTIDWDDVEVVFNDATTVAQNGGAGEDLARLVENVTEYAQGSPWSNLGITHDCPDTGIMVLRGWEHSRHEVIADAYKQLIKDYGVDIWIGLDDVLHLRKKRGVRRDDLAVSIVVDPNDPATLRALSVLADHRVRADPSQASNVIIVQGQSANFAVDEAGAFDLTQFGGLTLGKWEQAPVSATPLDLGERAESMLGVEKVAPVFPELVLPVGDNIPDPGDIIPVTVDCGWVQLTGDFRAQDVRVDPRTRTVSVQVDLDDGLPLDDDP